MATLEAPCLDNLGRPKALAEPVLQGTKRRSPQEPGSSSGSSPRRPASIRGSSQGNRAVGKAQLMLNANPAPSTNFQPCPCGGPRGPRPRARDADQIASLISTPGPLRTVIKRNTSIPAGRQTRIELLGQGPAATPSWALAKSQQINSNRGAMAKWPADALSVPWCCSTAAVG